MTDIIPVERVEQTIFIIREQKVILDADLAMLYGVPTKVFNQAVKRNLQRFPQDFMFQLTEQEKNELVTNCDRFKNLKHSTSLPYAFTEHGAVMAAAILNSQQAVAISIYVVRAFIKMRAMLNQQKELLKKLTDLEQKVTTHDTHIRSLFNAIRQLMEPPTPKPKPKNPIGFGQ
ncbi:MAG: ORF6N domain-containing protein [Deltaproteobacteria bacterium]|nr:ORF6N domain-containing protein [Deltaproteobacteria bacterium]